MNLINFTNDILLLIQKNRVTDFSDSSDAESVARTILDTYEMILSEYAWDMKYSFVNPVSVTDNAIELPDGIHKVHRVLIAKGIGCGSSSSTKVKEYLTEDHDRYPKIWNMVELHKDGSIQLLSDCLEPKAVCQEEILQCFCVSNCGSDTDVPDGMPTKWAEIGGKVVFDKYCHSNSAALSPATIRILAEGLRLLSQLLAQS